MLEYEVKVSGVEDITKLEKAVSGLEGVLASAKGSGKGLEEVRKIIVGLKGQGSVFQELANSIKSLDPAVARLEKVFQGVGSTLTHTIKSELEMTRAVFRTEIAGIAAGTGRVVAKEVSDEVGGGLVQGTREATAKAKSAAAKARAEMTKAYEDLVGGDGLKALSINELGEMKQLQELGATVSAYHKRMLKNYEQDLQQKRLMDAEWTKVAVAPSYAAMFKDFDVKVTQVSGKSAKDSASVFKDQFALELARGRQIFADFDKAMGLTKGAVAKSAKESAEVFNQVYAQSRARSVMPVQAMSGLDAKDAVYKTAMSQMREYYRSLEPLAPTLSKTGKGFSDAARNVDQFGTKIGDSHAAVRGLASGFNLLWLTWGNLGPLMAGAAISNTFMKSAKEGMQVADTLNTIKVLGEATTEEVAALNAELLRIGSSSIFGPKETAEAMKTLTLAGLKANEVLSQTRTVMDFSMAGDTNIQNAADVLVSVTTAFGTGAAGFSRSADIIVRAAADSKASVESFGEAMKTASVVGEQYGAQQEDVATLISLLANLGIQGSAAGTAIRNMYADLSGRTEKTAKIMKRFGLDFRDANGAMLPLVDTVKQMSNAMAQMEGKDAKSFLQALLSERGGKAMVAALAAYNQQIDVSGEKTNKLAAQVQRLQGTYGVTALAAAEMGESTLKAWQRAGAAMETSLDKAFSAMEPQLYRMAGSMQALFNDPSFIAGLQTIAGGIASLGTALAANSGLITGMLTVWGGWKLASVALSALLPKNTFEVLRLNAAHAVASAGLGRLTGMTTAYTGAALAKAQADRAVAAAQTQANLAAGSGVTVFGRLAGVLPVVGGFVAAGAVLWDLYASAQSRANSATQLGIDRSKNVIDQMEQRNDVMRAQIQALEEGRDAQEAANMVQARQQYDDAYKTKAADLENLRVSAEKAKKVIEELDNPNRVNMGGPGSEIGDTAARIGAQKTIDAYEAVKKELKDVEDQFTRTGEASQKLSRMLSNMQENQQAKEKEKADAALNDMLAKYGLNKGDLSFDPADPYGNGGKDRFRGPSAAMGYLDTQFEEFKQITEAEKTIVQALYDQGKVSATDYYDWVKHKQELTYEAERSALSTQIATMAAANPKDMGAQKSLKEATVKLSVLDLKYAGEKVRLEAEATKAIEERLTPMQQLVASAKDYTTSLLLSETELVSLRRGGTAVETAKEEIKVQEEFQKRRAAAEKEYIKSRAGKSGAGLAAAKLEYEEQLAALREYEAESLAIVQANAATIAAERYSGVNGMRQAFDDYAAKTADVAGAVRSSTTSVMNNLEDSIVDAMVTGKGSVSDFVTFALKELAKLTAQQGLGGLFGMISGAATSVIGGLWGSTGTAAASSQYSLTSGAASSGLGLKFNAKGGVYDSPSLSSYSNQVHSTPKLFAFAQGGVFGEAGPEAIMPLTRGADGNLGVRAFGGSGGANVNITTNVTVTSSGEVQQTQTQASGGSSMSEALGRELNVVIKDNIAREFRPGGVAWRYLNGYN